MARLEIAFHAFIYLLGVCTFGLALTYAAATFTPELEEMYWVYVCNG